MSGTLKERLAALWNDGRWAYVILLAMLLATGGAFWALAEKNRHNAQARFDERVDDIEDAIMNRMVTYTSVLRGGLALLKASDNVRRDEWAKYVATLEVNRYLSGIQGIGYTEFVQPERRDLYEARIRAEGFPSFAIRPDGDRALYSSITFLEPFNDRNRQAFGFDMYQEPTRRAAMDLAAATGQMTVSSRVTLVQELREDVQAGFLMYVPYYGFGPVPATPEARQESIIGFVYSPFRVRNLMIGILGTGQPDVMLEVHDGATATDDGLMYRTAAGPLPGHTPAFSADRIIDIGQRFWTLRITSLPRFETAGRGGEQEMTLIGGIALSLLVFGLLRSFAGTRQRAEALAASMTERLRKSTLDLERSNQELEQFAYIASHDLKAPLRGIDHLATWIEEDLGDALQGEPKENMKLLRNRVARLEALLNDLLSYSRAGRVEAKDEQVDIAVTAQELFDELNAGKRFALHLDLQHRQTKGRPAAIQQILGNLMSNSFKHHDATTGHIFLSTTRTDACTEWRYEDDGPGIAADQRDRALQMFQTLQPRDKVEGSGMGLAIVKKLVESRGGTIGIEDRPDGARGVLFRIRWPR